MGTENKIDLFDEALRLIYLDQVQAMGDERLQQELPRVLEENKGDVSAAQKKLFIGRLTTVLKQPSFGELIRSAVQERQLTDAMLTERTGISPTITEALRNDTVYPNNVPIQLLKKLIVELKLSYAVVKEAILKTFDLLQQQMSLKDMLGYEPAYRKGSPLFPTGHVGNGTESNGNELFENKEALNKYLTRLEELVNT